MVQRKYFQDIKMMAATLTSLSQRFAHHTVRKKNQEELDLYMDY